MKRVIALILAALLLCGMGSALAEEYYNIVELRQQTPERLTKSYETKWGQVNIDVPIIIPEYDQLPAIAYRPLAGSKEFPSAATETLADDDAGLWSFSVNMERNWKAVPKGYGASDKPYDQAIAENNGFLPEEATAFADALVRKYTSLVPGIDTDPLQAKAGSAYYLYDWDTGEFIDGLGPIDDETLNKGSYRFSIRQWFHGLPLETRTGVGGYTFLSDAPFSDYGIIGSFIFMDIIDMEHYSFDMLLCEETALLAEDVPLVDFDTVWTSVEKYIETGHIHSVQSIRLIGMTGIVPPGGNSYADRTCWGVPFWEIECEFWQNPNDGSVDVDTLYLRVDAQTGKIPDLYSKDETRLRYHELITWDQLQ